MTSHKSSYTEADVEAGQAAYTPLSLALYDLWVTQISNRFIWRCAPERIQRFFDQHVSENHLEVGVGSGYYPAHCEKLGAGSRVALMDLNPDSLDFTAKRLARLAPEKIQADVLQPIEQEIAPFDSICLNYLIHCLPGSIDTKAVVFENLKPLLNPGGVLFGTTLLQGGVQRTPQARLLMALYNRRKLITNRYDDLRGLRKGLEANFSGVEIDVQGAVALFAAKT